MIPSYSVAQFTVGTIMESAAQDLISNMGPTSYLLLAHISGHRNIPQAKKLRDSIRNYAEAEVQVL